MRVTASLERSFYVPGEGNINLHVDVVSQERGEDLPQQRQQHNSNTNAGNSTKSNTTNTNGRSNGSSGGAVKSLAVHCYGVEKLEASWVNLKTYHSNWKATSPPPGVQLGRGEHLVFSSTAAIIQPTSQQPITQPTSCKSLRQR